MIWVELESNVAHPISSVCVPLSDENRTFRNVTDDGWLNYDRLGFVLASVYAKEERHTPLLHRGVQCPTVVDVPGQELY